MRSAAPLPPLAPGVPPSLTVQVYRFFFYRWLFLDADAGSVFERSVALRHNRAQAKWLPVYMGRWAVLGGVLAVLETLAERYTGNSPLAAALALGLVGVALYLLVTAICWAFLRESRRGR